MNRERTDVRRRDRAKDDAWIREFLKKAPFGFLATVAEGSPFLNSNLFVYDESDHSIYLHTARAGRTPENVSRGGPAAFSAAVLGRFLPAATALGFSLEYASAVAFGRVAPVTGKAEKRQFMKSLMEKYAGHLKPGRDYHPITDEELARTAVHRLEVEEWSGKEKTVEPDFPGAFSVGVPSLPILPITGQ